jgi:iron complex outermembrane receptor protein
MKLTFKASTSVFSIAAVALAMALTGPAPAAQAQDAADGEEGDVIIVTGTRRQGRTISNSPVPIDVIGADALTEQGFTEVNKALNLLVPSFNFPQPSITDGTDAIRPATLRGLSPDQTLVLVNGKRRHVTSLLNINGSVGRGAAAVDLNLIPSLAIDRIEVLRDGAASQYGSDAIAGVLNVQLRRASEGVTASATFGQYITELQDVPNIVGVFTDAGGLPIVLPDGTLAVQGEGERRARDGEMLTLAANIGLPLFEDGYFNITGEYRDRNRTDRGGFDPRRQYPTIGDPRELTFDRLSHRYGDADTVDYAVFLNAGAPINPETEFYFFGSFNERDGESAGFYRRALDARNRDFTNEPLPPAPLGPFVPFYPDGFLPLIVTDTNDLSAGAGVKGEIASWNWDLSGVYGRNRLDFNVENSFNTSFGQASQTEFDSGGLEFSQTTINLDLQREFDVGFLSDTLSLAFGAEYRRENFGIRAGDVQSFAAGPFAAPFGAPAGAQVFPGFRPENEVDADRDSYAVYAELETDLTARWTVQVAGRFEDYSDFGTTLNGKFATRFEINDAIALRGAISSGFRAPSLHQQFFATNSTNNVGGVLVEIGTFPVDSPVAQALGSSPLEPEQSLNLSGGVTLNLFDGFNITADYYRITIDDRIVVTENLQGPAIVTILQNAGFNNITSARFFINGLDTRTQGVDVIATYGLELGAFGALDLTGGFNWNKTEITDEVATLGPLAMVPGLDLFGRVESLRIERGQPRTKLTLSGIWTKGIASATLRSTRFGEVFSPAVNPLDDVVLTPKWITDIEGRLQLTDNVGVAVGANNVLDVYPDINPVGPRPGGGFFPQNNYFLPYSVFSPFGFNGRFVYARAIVEF